MVLALSLMASASLSNDAPISIELGTTEFTFEVNATDSTGLEGIITSDNANISIGAIGVDNLATVTVSNIASDFDAVIGYVNATDDNKTDFSVNVEYTFCSNGEQGINFEITDFEANNKGNGEDDEWNYFDEVEFEVTVENRDDEKLRDVTVEIIIFDENGLDVTDEFVDDNEVDLGNIGDDEEEMAVLKVDSVKPKDLDEGKYRAYFKAYSEDEEEDNKCTQDIDYDNLDYFEFEINNEDLEGDLLIDETEEVLASCGEDGVSVTFDVWNLGAKQDPVLVNLYNSALGVDEYVIVDSLREGKSESVNFIFDMPAYLARPTYNLEVFLHYNYEEDDGEKEDEDAYDDNSNDDGDDFNIIVKVLECKAPEPTVNVETTEDAKSGKEFTFEVAVKNNAADAQNIIVTVDGVDSWAEDMTVTPGVLALQGGAEGVVTVTLKPTETGSQTFTVKTLIGVEEYSQTVNVEVESRFAVGQYFSTEYWEYWVAIALVVLILIVLISIIAVMRK